MSLGMPSSTEIFMPPQGLLPYEKVLWAQRSSWAFSGKNTTAVLLTFGGLFVSVSLYFLGGPALPPCMSQYPQTSSGDPWWLLGIGIVSMLGGLFSLYRTITQRGTGYYLTTFKLVKGSWWKGRKAGLTSSLQRKDSLPISLRSSVQPERRSADLRS